MAQAGESLYTLSQRVYGSSSYWYLLAAANGLGDPQAALTEGQSLQVPEVAVSRNDARTFKPYNANEALGPTTPVLPYIPPSDKGCGVVVDDIAAVEPDELPLIGHNIHYANFGNRASAMLRRSALSNRRTEAPAPVNNRNGRGDPRKIARGNKMLHRRWRFFGHQRFPRTRAPRPSSTVGRGGQRVRPPR